MFMIINVITYFFLFNLCVGTDCERKIEQKYAKGTTSGSHFKEKLEVRKKKTRIFGISYKYFVSLSYVHSIWPCTYYMFMLMTFFYTQSYIF